MAIDDFTIPSKDSPEELFSSAEIEEANQGMPSDDMHCAVDRAKAVIELLSAQFYYEDSQTVPADTIRGVLSSARRDLSELTDLINQARHYEQVLHWADRYGKVNS